MTALRNEIQTRLFEEVPDYRALVALDRALTELGGDASPPSAGVAANGGGAHAPRAPREPLNIEKLSQPDAAEILLTSVLHEPTATGQLVKALAAHGVEVGGAKPNINLSSVLSKDGRFRSVQFKERKGWWVKGRPFPGELDPH